MPSQNHPQVACRAASLPALTKRATRTHPIEPWWGYWGLHHPKTKFHFICNVHQTSPCFLSATYLLISANKNWQNPGNKIPSKQRKEVGIQSSGVSNRSEKAEATSAKVPDCHFPGDKPESSFRKESFSSLSTQAASCPLSSPSEHPQHLCTQLRDFHTREQPLNLEVTSTC